MLTGYDIIGDVHGYADQLESLLTRMGYGSEDGVYRHPERRAIFVGDLIDRGPRIRDTVKIVRNMVENDQALMVMGNHEYNAIAYHTPDGKGDFLRARTAMHVENFRGTVDAYAGFEEQWAQDLDWMRQLPLFLELGGLRIVHAMWHEDHVETLSSEYGGRLSDELLYRAHQKGTPEYSMVEDTLKGREISLPHGVTFIDKDNCVRHNARVCWWKNPAGLAYHDYLMHFQPLAIGVEIPFEAHNEYPADASPVFFGHYWYDNKRPTLLAPNVACLDYSVANGGFLCAYRWDGEQRLSETKFIF